jgi:hypothetical protein
MSAGERKSDRDAWHCDICGQTVQAKDLHAAISRHIASARHLEAEETARKYRELLAGRVSPYLPPRTA